MSKKRSWSSRLDQILNDLEQFEGKFFRRSEIERIFGIGHSQAYSLMELAGKYVYNGEAAVAKDGLLLWLETGPEAQAFRRERDRRRSLWQKLEPYRKNLIYRSVPIPNVKPDDEWATFETLPEITLEPGRMEIRFQDKPELLGILWRLSKALINDWPTFEKLCGANMPTGFAFNPGSEAPGITSGTGGYSTVSAGENGGSNNGALPERWIA